ncbi:MAG: ABC transporter ATP-binding protein [Rhizobacter sp.]|nr:ABC transporter ATP-binding protein [Chlorobiales bacterium]
MSAPLISVSASPDPSAIVSAAPSHPLIDLTRITRIYNAETAPLRALDDISFSIDAGTFVSIVGKSGSGKSTLLNLIAGMDKPTSGEITVAGKVVSEMTSEQLSLYRRSAVGMIFQSFNLITSMTAAENVALPLFFSGTPEQERNARAIEMLETVGLAARAKHRPTELSGGEQQRVAIARALVTNPAFILADEPTGNLDTKTSDDITDLLSHINRHERKTIVMITHDVPLALRLSTRIITLQDGKIKTVDSH